MKLIRVRKISLKELNFLVANGYSVMITGGKRVNANQ